MNFYGCSPPHAFAYARVCCLKVKVAITGNGCIELVCMYSHKVALFEIIWIYIYKKKKNPIIWDSKFSFTDSVKECVVVKLIHY